MRQADAFDSTLHRENLSRSCTMALQLAELAGNEQDAGRRPQRCAACRLHGPLACSTALAATA
jgi:hypothetical protein